MKHNEKIIVGVVIVLLLLIGGVYASRSYHGTEDALPQNDNQGDVTVNSTTTTTTSTTTTSGSAVNAYINSSEQLPDGSDMNADGSYEGVDQAQ